MDLQEAVVVELVERRSNLDLQEAVAVVRGLCVQDHGKEGGPCESHLSLQGEVRQGTEGEASRIQDVVWQSGGSMQPTPYVVVSYGRHKPKHGSRG